MPPDEEIPVGRKRPLRQQSKARIMTASNVYDDIKRQQDAIKEKEERIRKRREGQLQKNEQKKKPTTKKAVPKKPSKTINTRSKSTKFGIEDNECFSCSISWASEKSMLQTKWVGCEGKENTQCPH